MSSLQGRELERGVDLIVPSQRGRARERVDLTVPSPRGRVRERG